MVRSHCVEMEDECAILVRKDVDTQWLIYPASLSAQACRLPGRDLLCVPVPLHGACPLGACCSSIPSARAYLRLFEPGRIVLPELHVVVV
jgi:hypothetical protein